MHNCPTPLPPRVGPPAKTYPRADRAAAPQGNRVGVGNFPCPAAVGDPAGTGIDLARGVRRGLENRYREAGAGLPRKHAARCSSINAAVS